MKKMILAALLFTVAAQAQTTQIEYTPNEALIRNPERGYLMQFYSKPGDTYIPLSVQFADPEDNYGDIFQANNLSLIQFVVKLDDFFNTDDIPDDFLNNVLQLDFDYMRANHIKCVLRFCYTNGDPIDGAYDPGLSRIMSHIDDLKDFTRKNQDVISSMEAGFIGNYGEWYSGGEDFGIGYPGVPQLGIPGAMTEAQLGNRKTVGLEILTMTDNRIVAFRTPFYQRLIAPPSSQDKLFPKYNGGPGIRVAAHDDAFLHQRNDQGTFIIVSENPETPQADDTADDRKYLASKSYYTFTGGESNEPKSDGDLPGDPIGDYWHCYTGANILGMNAMDQLAAYHYNYLNYSYNEDVTSLWQTEGCYDEIHAHLGYRYELTKASLNSDTRKLNVQLYNRGFGHAHNYRPVYLVMQDDAGHNYRLTIAGPTDSEGGNGLAPDTPTDIRAWYPQESGSPVSGRAVLRKTMENLKDINGEAIPPGHYQLYLELPDGDDTDDGVEVDDLLQNDPGYSIRLANTDDYIMNGEAITSNIPFWSPETGLNNLFLGVSINKDGTMGKLDKPAVQGKAKGIVFNAKASPNPFEASCQLTIKTSSDEAVAIQVVDVLGKTLENRMIAANQLENVEIGQGLAAGVYAVIVKQGSDTQRLRIVKK